MSTLNFYFYIYFSFIMHLSQSSPAFIRSCILTRHCRRTGISSIQCFLFMYSSSITQFLPSILQYLDMTWYKSVPENSILTRCLLSFMVLAVIQFVHCLFFFQNEQHGLFLYLLRACYTFFVRYISPQSFLCTLAYRRNTLVCNIFPSS